MTEYISLYLGLIDNFNGRHTNVDKVQELLSLFAWQVDKNILLERFPAGSKAGDLLRGLTNHQHSL